MRAPGGCGERAHRRFRDPHPPGAKRAGERGRVGEQAPDLGPRLALEDQPRAQADDSQPPLELVERALGGRLVAGVEAGRDALARPRLVDGSISVTRSSPASARTTLVPTLPVAPVTTIRIPAGYPSSTTSAE
jgi:hypothetical protein